MRLWHSETIPYLPKGQLLAQWRELNSIFAKQDRHILINYIYEYPLDDLYVYTEMIMSEMKNRGYNIRTFDKMARYFEDFVPLNFQHPPFARHHDEEYFEICYFNLKEKFIRGQKDYDPALFYGLQNLYYSKTSR